MATDGVNGLSKPIMAVISNLESIDRRELKFELKAKLSEMLSNGQITKDEMKQALDYVDRDLQKALIGRTKNEGGRQGLQHDANISKLLDKANLQVDDLYSVSHLAGEDFTINTVKLSKEEKAEGAKGELTRSELENIKNQLNEKIKARGGDYELSDNEVIKLMKGIGLEDGTKKTSNLKGILLGILPPLNIANAITTVRTDGIVNFANKRRDEEAYGEQDASGVNITNKTETKMKELEKYRVEVEETPQDIVNPPKVDE